MDDGKFTVPIATDDGRVLPEGASVIDFLRSCEDR